MTCIKTGAIVHMRGHEVVFSADLFEVAGAIVVRANGPIVRGKNAFNATDGSSVNPFLGRVTHVLEPGPETGFWREDLGTFVVPKSQCFPGVA